MGGTYKTKYPANHLHLRRFSNCGTSSKCRASLQNFLTFCEDIGVPTAPEKTEGLDQALTFAGIELDYRRHEARLPMEKVTKCLSAIRNLLCKKKVELKELQSIIGLLNFACSVISPGRVFLRRLINLTIGIRRSYYFIRVTQETIKICKSGKPFWALSMGNHFSWRKPGLHLIAYVFTLMQPNLAVMVSSLVNSGHMVGGQSLGKSIIQAFSSFSQLL